MENIGDKTWQQRLHEIIYESDTRAAKLFDVAAKGMMRMPAIVNIVGENCKAMLSR